MRVIIWALLILDVLNNFTPAWSCGSGTDIANLSPDDCPDGYSIEECIDTFKRDECKSSPCRNGGTCEDRFDEYDCACRHGFRGEMCQHDYERPRIKCPPNQVIELTDSNAVAVNWDQPVVTDNSGYALVTADDSRHRSGDMFMEGNTVVQYVAKDRAGNTQNCSFNIYLERASKCDSSPCKNGATCETLFNDITCFCRRGFEGGRCEHDVEVPDIICPDEVYVKTKSNSYGAIAVWHELTVSDNSVITTAHLTSSHKSGDVFPIGSTTVTVSVVDDAQNMNKCSFKVTVKGHIFNHENSDPLVIFLPLVGFIVLVAVVAIYSIHMYRRKNRLNNPDGEMTAEPSDQVSASYVPLPTSDLPPDYYKVCQIPVEPPPAYEEYHTDASAEPLACNPLVPRPMSDSPPPASEDTENHDASAEQPACNPLVPIPMYDSTPPAYVDCQTEHHDALCRTTCSSASTDV